MRQATVYCNRELAGYLIEESSKSYIFRYDDVWYRDASKPAISLTLPKSQQVYQGEYLFPFFVNMLSEGVNRQLQSIQLRIDEEDNFGLLISTAQYDTIGAITLRPVTTP